MAGNSRTFSTKNELLRMKDGIRKAVTACCVYIDNMDKVYREEH